jgi:hypothetical protein
MAPGRYTELFFLDEATGAGRRASTLLRVPAAVLPRLRRRLVDRPPRRLRGRTTDVGCDRRATSRRAGRPGSLEAHLPGEPRRPPGRRVCHAGWSGQECSPHLERRATCLVAGRLSGATAASRGRVGVGTHAGIDREGHSGGVCAGSPSVGVPSVNCGFESAPRHRTPSIASTEARHAQSCGHLKIGDRVNFFPRHEQSVVRNLRIRPLLGHEPGDILDVDQPFLGIA